MTLDELKAHLNLDHDADDVLLVGKLTAAQVWVGTYIGTPLTSLQAIPANVSEAVLQLAASWYEQREAVAFGNAWTVPFGVHELLAPARTWSAF